MSPMLCISTWCLKVGPRSQPVTRLQSQRSPCLLLTGTLPSGLHILYKPCGLCLCCVHANSCVAPSLYLERQASASKMAQSIGIMHHVSQCQGSPLSGMAALVSVAETLYWANNEWAPADTCVHGLPGAELVSLVVLSLRKARGMPAGTSFALCQCPDHLLNRDTLARGVLMAAHKGASAGRHQDIDAQV